jgi:hypothetical protein
MRIRKFILPMSIGLILLLVLYVIYPHLPFGRKISPAELDTITVSLRNGTQVVLDRTLTARLVKTLETEWYVVPIWTSALEATAQLKNGDQCDLLMNFYSGSFVMGGQGFKYHLAGDSRVTWDSDVRALFHAALMKHADNETEVR